MKLKIDGKTYDTETAIEVAGYSRGARRDHQFIHETLYRTPKGHWFLDGESGPAECYAQNVGNSCIAGRSLIPLTPEEVADWVRRRDPAVYELLSVAEAAEAY